MKKSFKLTVSAIMVALAFVLAWVSKIIPSPWLQGGSVTIASAVPIIVVSLMCGNGWGILASFVYAILQMMTGFYAPPTPDFVSFLLVILFDYVFAFGVYGIAGVFYNTMGKKNFAIPVSGCIVMILRYICHIVSGIFIWGVYAEGQTVLAYSVTYNGGYMIPEIIITTAVLALMIPVIKRLERNYVR